MPPYIVARSRLSVRGSPFWVNSTNSGSTKDPTAVFSPKCLPSKNTPSKNNGIFSAHWTSAGWKPNSSRVITEIPVTPPEAT
ncbi:hypothetical protein D3C81_1987000 [compost metagenome]